ncbi:MAG: ferrous iron transport protein B [Candidatus Omnitrophota bacterium]|jgi:ferrous iron transport protein B
MSQPVSNAQNEDLEVNTAKTVKNNHDHNDECASKTGKIFLVGNPNVGKSSIFNALTNSYVTVSNYPGTTVGIASGKLRIGGHHEFSVIDTPGMYSMRPITGEESVARNYLLEQIPACILHVVDAKNLERMLPLTLQLIETGHPVILVLNLYDELESRGMQLDVAHLEHDLGIPVIETVATRGRGMQNLKARIVEVADKRYKFNMFKTNYSPEIENRIANICEFLDGDYEVSNRTVAALIAQGDSEVIEKVEKRIGSDKIKEIMGDLSFRQSAQIFIQDRLKVTRKLIAEHLKFVQEANKEPAWKEHLSHLLIHPIFGVPILLAVLYFGLFKFVGEFGAGTCVNFIEGVIFGQYINPPVQSFFAFLFGDNMFYDLFAGDYGIITLGVRYAFAIVLPIVSTFFIAFSMIEDSGYLPRLAMLVDKMFKSIGLSGRAVIPITLGFGCDTMATITTRTLESKKERIIATFLLSLTIPCSAQLGVILGILGNSPKMLVLWALTMGVVFLISGWMAKQVFKGEGTSFFMELPPLRMPSVVNVFTKTYSRMVWYFIEIVPIFLYASVIIWFGKLTGLFEMGVKLIAYPVTWVGMPEGVAPVFLYGFFRRDFGAAGLFDMANQGTLSGNGMLIATVVLTLFVPCIAQFAVMWKERGGAMAMGMAAFIFPFAFFIGYVLNGILNLTGIQL